MVNRRDFLKLAGTATGTAAVAALAGPALAAGPVSRLSPDRQGVLVDATVCIGCRRCEWACARQNGLPHGELDAYDDQSVFAQARRPSSTAYTVVNRWPVQEGRQRLDLKVNCLHCERPACVSACIVGALKKDPRGPVTYDAKACIGCRYCQVACPFQIPSYEYEKALTPQLRKCDLCATRTLEEGKRPACVEMCPPEALVYGRRADLVELAENRIRMNPDRYDAYLYGQHEVGGTSWLYLLDRPYAKAGLPALAEDAPSAVTERIQHGIFKGFSGPLMMLGLLSVLMKSSSDRRRDKDQEQDQDQAQDRAKENRDV
jgi:formate dehydrogenase iron-sulfur subunit